MKVKKLKVNNMKLDIGFNKKLYLDGIRQLKLVGIMGLVVLCAAALLTAIGYHINTSAKTVNIMDAWGNIVVRAPEGLNLYQIHWALFLTFPILAPVMTMMLFNFLNHRNASDFYHAIPDTRGTLYISYMAAILTWLGAIIGISTALSVFCVSILPGYYVIWSGVPKALFLIIAACVLVMGGVSIALGLTGTRMSNLMVTLIILFLPRFFVTVIMYILEDMMPFVAWEYSSSLFNPRYDLIAGLPLALFSEINPFRYGGSGVYSLILGLIYLVVGYMIFLKRKSESAGHAAITPKMQGIFRLSVSMTICLLPMYFITECWVDLDPLDGDSLFFILVFYVIAVLAYFIYELMTTGKLRSFKKLCRGIGVLAILNVILFFVIIGIYGATIKSTPDAEDVDYVMIQGYERDYFEAQLQRIKIREDEVAEITVRALERTIEYQRNNRYGSYFDQYGNYVETVTKTVAINSGLRTIYRDVIYTVKEWNSVLTYLSRLPEYHQVYRDLPEYDSREMSIYCEWGNFDTAQVVKIYEVMREEVKTIDFVEWYSAIDGYSYGGEQYVDTIRLTLDIGTTGNRDTIRLPILNSMHETLNCYMEEILNSETAGEMKDSWKQIYEMADGEFDDFTTSNTSIEISASIFGEKYFLKGIDGNLSGYEDKNGWVLNEYGIAKDGKTEQFLTFIDKLYGGEYQMSSDPYAWLVVDVYAYSNGYPKKGSNWINPSVNGRFCIPLCEPIPEEIQELMGEALEKFHYWLENGQ